MRIYIHFKFIDSGWGGSNSFLKTLRDYLVRQPGIQLVSSIHRDHDILLMAGWSTGGRWTDVPAIENVRSYGRTNVFLRGLLGRRRPPLIVHRVDGIGYKYGRADRKGDDIQFQLIKLSDYSVVQSRYSEKLFLEEGVRFEPARTRIIHNGVDQKVFHPAGKTPWDKKRPLILGAVSWSPNAKKGHAEIAKYSALPGVRVRFAGNWAKDVEPLGVERHPPVSSSQLSEFYRSCDAFLFPAQGESCPNAVLEAISCGLPVIYHPSGGTPEVAAPFGIALKGEPAAVLEELRGRYDALREAVLTGRDAFSIEAVGQKYVELFRQISPQR